MKYLTLISTLLIYVLIASNQRVMGERGINEVPGFSMRSKLLSCYSTLEVSSGCLKGVATNNNIAGAYITYLPGNPDVPGALVQVNQYNFIRSHNITVGNFPEGVAIDPKTNVIYVANRDDDTVSIINGTSTLNGTSDNVIPPVNVGHHPYGVAVNTKTHIIYIANSGYHDVSIINGTSMGYLPPVNVGNQPTHIAVNPDTNMIYVVNTKDNTTSVINGKTNIVVKTIPVDHYPYGVAVNPKTNMIYVANQDSNSVSVINGASNKISVGVTFNFNDADSGNQVLCKTRSDYKVMSDKQYVRYDFGTPLECKAQTRDQNLSPIWRFISSESSQNSYFSFKNWNSNLPIIKFDPHTDTITFNASQYGEVTANFEEHVPYKLDFWVALFTIIAGIPVVVGFVNKFHFNRHKRYLNK